MLWNTCLRCFANQFSGYRPVYCGSKADGIPGHGFELYLWVVPSCAWRTKIHLIFLGLKNKNMGIWFRGSILWKKWNSKMCMPPSSTLPGPCQWGLGVVLQTHKVDATIQEIAENFVEIAQFKSDWLLNQIQTDLQNNHFFHFC